MPEVPPLFAVRISFAVLILAGLVLCFFGFRLLKLALGIMGFVVGGTVASYIVWTFTADAAVVAAAKTYPEIIKAMFPAEPARVVLVWACCGGIAGAVLSVLLHRVGVFVLGIGLGWVVTNATMARAGREMYFIVLAVLGVIGGLVALAVRRMVVIASTAINGAALLVFGMYSLLKGHTSPEAAISALQTRGIDTWVVAGCTIVLAAIGAYVQFRVLPEPEREKPQKEASEKGNRGKGD